MSHYWYHGIKYLVLYRYNAYLGVPTNNIHIEVREMLIKFKTDSKRIIFILNDHK